MNHLSLVLLPGLDGTGEGFRPLIQLLPPELAPVVVRYPSETPLTYDDATAYAETLLPRDSRIVLLGESYSGPVALKLAARHPGAVAAVILCATFVTPPLPAWLLRLGALPALSFFLRHPPRFLLRYFLAGWDAPADYIEQLVGMLKSSQSSILASRVRNIAGVDVQRELAECSVPILYLCSANDKIVRTHKTEEIRASRPDIAVARIASPHQLLQRHPQQALGVIMDFLARQHGASEKH